LFSDRADPLIHYQRVFGSVPLVPTKTARSVKDKRKFKTFAELAAYRVDHLGKKRP